MIHILLPAYNEAENIKPLLESIEKAYPNWDPNLNAGDIRAVVVNDGSGDDTSGQTKAFQGHIHVDLVEHETNQGLGAALLTGLRHILSQCGDDDYIISLDADGTHHPQFISRILEQLNQGKDIVVASRYAEGGKEFGVSWIRKLLSLGARICYGLFFRGWNIQDFSCGFRGMRASVVRKTHERWGGRLLESPGFSCTGELMLKCLHFTTPDNVAEVPFELHYEAKGGDSKMPAFKTIIGTFRLLIASRNW